MKEMLSCKELFTVDMIDEPALYT